MRKYYGLIESTGGVSDTVESAAFKGKCEAQRQIADYQLGIPMPGTKHANPYAMRSTQWFAYESAFSDYVNMAFERDDSGRY